MKKAKFYSSIGIVGGAGPAASAFLYNKIIEVCQKELGSNDYNEFPEIIIESYPFIRGDNDMIRRDIAVCFRKLQSAGAKIFCVASNSFHAFLPDISSIFFLNLIEETLKEAESLNIKMPLILASQTTIDLKLYESERFNCMYPKPKDQKLIQKIIREVAGGVVTNNQAAQLIEIAEQAKREFLIDAVIIGCTELPLIHHRFPLSKSSQLPIIDSVATITKSLIRFSQIN